MPFDPATLIYNDAGLIPAIAQEAATGEVLMLAWMNAEAVARTLETGRVTYWSRSRRRVLGQGRDLGPCAGAGRAAGRLRPRLPAGAGATRRARPATPTGGAVSYTAVRDGAEVELMRPVEE